VKELMHFMPKIMHELMQQGSCWKHGQRRPVTVDVTSEKQAAQ